MPIRAPSSVFILRMTGFPVETIRSLASPALAEAGDVALAQGGPLKPPAAFGELYEAEFNRTRAVLYEQAASERFRQVLLASSPELESYASTGKLPEKRSRHGKMRERTWFLYLQRLTTKNETVSFYGPSTWGTVDPTSPLLADIELAEPVAANTVFVERWVCEALARLIEQDPDVRPFLAPELEDDLLVDDRGAVRLETGEVVPLSPEQRALLAGVDGAWVPGRDRLTEVERAIEARLLVLKLHVPLGSAPFPGLCARVAAFREPEARRRWQPVLERIEALRAEYASSFELDVRRAALASLSALLAEVGVDAARSAQALYAARLPINEDCRRGARRLTLGAPFVELVSQDLAPWFELWKDLAGLYATRIHERLGKLFEEAGGRQMPMPQLLAACAKAGLPVAKEGGSGLLPAVESEIQAAWHEQLGSRASQREVQLTSEDLAFVRNRFRFRRMKAFDVPAPDLQLAASSREALARGEFVPVLGEIHPDFVLWEHALFSSCTDPSRLIAEFPEERRGPAAMFSRSLSLGSVHTVYRAWDQLPGWTFIGPHRGERARHLRTAEVVARLTDDDVVLETRAGEVVGSMINNWEVALNTHQLLLLGSAPHSPRLKVGRVVVQRESWVVEPNATVRKACEEAGPRAFLALRALRRDHVLPEEAFAWPQLPMRMTVHKDAKPIHVDFRSPLAAEALSALVRRFVAFRFFEVLPGTGDCWLGDEKGHYSFELRLGTVGRAGR